MEDLLTFLISLRKIIFWIVVPSTEELEIMDFFVRYIRQNCISFPKITEAEEDIQAVLDKDFHKEEKTHLKYFLLNHFQLLEVQYKLYLLTTK